LIRVGAKLCRDSGPPGPRLVNPAVQDYVQAEATHPEVSVIHFFSDGPWLVPRTSEKGQFLPF